MYCHVYRDTEVTLAHPHQTVYLGFEPKSPCKPFGTVARLRALKLRGLQFSQSTICPLTESFSAFVIRFLIVQNFSFARLQPALDLWMVVEKGLVHRLENRHYHE